MKIRFLKSEQHFKKGGIGTNPAFFWNILLIIAFLIILTSFVFGLLLFKQINQESILSVENIDEKSQTVNEERIKKVLEYFSDRENKSINILNSPSPVVDPSL
jgi:uncharacterized membrane protein